MGRKKARPTDTRVELLCQQIEHWPRVSAKRSPMPEPLWRGCWLAQHGVYAAALALV